MPKISPKITCLCCGESGNIEIKKDLIPIWDGPYRQIGTIHGDLCLRCKRCGELLIPILKKSYYEAL